VLILARSFITTDHMQCNNTEYTVLYPVVDNSLSVVSIYMKQGE